LRVEKGWGPQIIKKGAQEKVREFHLPPPRLFPPPPPRYIPGNHFC